MMTAVQQEMLNELQAKAVNGVIRGDYIDAYNNPSLAKKALQRKGYMPSSQSYSSKSPNYSLYSKGEVKKETGSGKDGENLSAEYIKEQLKRRGFLSNESLSQRQRNALSLNIARLNSIGWHIKSERQGRHKKDSYMIYKLVPAYKTFAKLLDSGEFIGYADIGVKKRTIMDYAYKMRKAGWQLRAGRNGDYQLIEKGRLDFMRAQK